MKNIFLGFFICLFSIQTSAWGSEFTLSLGNLCEYIGKIQTDDKGSTNICSFNPYLSSSLDYPIKGQWIFSPELGTSFPRHGQDEQINKISFFGNALMKYKFQSFHLASGLGIFITRISGNGGNQDLNNGNSISSFPMPDTASYSRNFIFKILAGIDFNPFWSMDFYSLIFNIENQNSRAFSLGLNATYHFGEM